MRNLKKILALVLALVMSLSLVTMANADFTDAAEIEHKEAVEVMAAAGVLAGLEDGSFNPDGILTRAQAAKIVAYVLTGGAPADVTGAPFSDVPASHWAASSVAFVAGKGIVSGNGDGTFNPNGKLTGYAFAKMLLGALEIEGTFTGLGWEVNVADAAEDAKLLEKLDDVALGDPLSREHAAQMALNAMIYTAKSSSYAIEVDGETVKFDTQEDALLYAKLMGGTYKGEVESTEDTILKETFKITRSTIAEDAYGRPATSYTHKDWDAKMVFAKEADYTYVADEATTVAKLVKDDELKNAPTMDIFAGSSVEVYVNDDDEIVDVVAIMNTIVEITEVKALTEKKNADEIKAGAEYSIKVKDVKGTVTTLLDVQIENFDEDEYVKDARIMVPVVYTSLSDIDYPTYDKKFEKIGTKWVLIDSEVAEGVDGKVTASAAKYIRVDGEKYVLAANGLTAPALKAEGTFYTDANGFVIGYKADGGADITLDDVMYVVDTYKIEGAKDAYGKTTGVTYYAQVINLVDSSVENVVIGIDKNANNDVADDDDQGVMTATAGALVTKEADDDVYTLKTWEDSDYVVKALAAGSLKADDTKVTVDSTLFRLEDGTTYISTNGKTLADLEVETKDGGVAKTFTGGVIIAKKDGSNNITAYAILAGAAASSTSYDDVVYVDGGVDLEDVTVEVDGKEVSRKSFSVYDEAGDKKTVIAESVPADKTFYTYEIDEDGIYTFKKVAAATIVGAEYKDESGVITGKFSSLYGTKLTLNTAKMADIEAKDATIIDLRTADDIDEITSLEDMNALATEEVVADRVFVDLVIFVDEGAVVIVVVDPAA